MLCILSCSLAVFGQKRVAGTVFDVNGEPVVGANILEKGTLNGSITDVEGNFSLAVRDGAVLQISYIGYISQEVTVGNQTTLKITLREDMQALEEIVVVGYGTQQKKDITGSVAVVNTKDLLASSGASAVQQLQGKASGVFVGASGAPGSPTMIRIRGINTINDNGPLFVIDGVSTRNQDLASLNPNDIESMQVLKDASAAAIYGAQAANGVVLITTKRGTTSGQPVVSYDGYFGLQKTGKRYDLLSSAERLQWEWEAQQNFLTLVGSSDKPAHQQFGVGANGFIVPNYLTGPAEGAAGRQDISPSGYSYPDNLFTEYYDGDGFQFWDAIDRVAPVQNHQISLSGGTDKGTYNMSANYYDQQGTLIHTYYTRYTVRANSSYNVRPWLRFGENFSYTWSKDLGRNANLWEDTPYSWAGIRVNPWVPVYDVAGNFAGSTIVGTGNWANPVANLTRDKENYYSNSRVFGNLWAEADLYRGLTFRTSFGLDYRNAYSYRMNKKNLEFSESSKINNLEEKSSFNFRWVWTNTLTYTRSFNDIHKLTALLGTEAIRDGLGREMTGYRTGYLYEDNVNTWVLNMGEKNDQMNATSSYNGEFALFGIFGRVDYAFNDKYLVTGSMRRDGVSRFSAANRYGLFPSLSLGWRLSGENFMDSTRDWLDDLKLRVGYGQNGNAEIPRATNFAYEFTTNPERTNYNGQLGYRLERFGNEDTKWEATENLNIGLDATFLNGKFGVSLEWYNRTTTDMLIAASYSALAGEADKPFVNFGDMQNIGVDANFNYRDRHGDWAWDLSLNVGHYRNKVVRLSEADDYALWGNGARLDGQPATRTTKGRPMSEFYGFKVDGFYESVDDVLARQPLGQNLSAEEARSWVGRFRFANTNGDKVLDNDDRVPLGSPHPDLFGGLNASVTYRNFDFTMFWYYSVGNEIFNNTRSFIDFNLFYGNRSKRSLYESWRPGADNSKAKVPLLNTGDTYSRSYMSSYYIEDGSYLKMKNIVLGYTFPKALLEKATIRNIRLYLQAENLLTLTKYSGLTPEINNTNNGDTQPDLRRGVDVGGWPNVMNFLFGLNFTF
ncbi:MAG: TonB-dependent receptor [Tannerella sp.]|jgi:TonB-linked SusC/RagA family outer membrane protein|nr:TonB-dependent receptor [Tannerella sp.]